MTVIPNKTKEEIEDVWKFVIKLIANETMFWIFQLFTRNQYYKQIDKIADKNSTWYFQNYIVVDVVSWSFVGHESNGRILFSKLKISLFVYGFSSFFLCMFYIRKKNCHMSKKKRMIFSSHHDVDEYRFKPYIYDTCFLLFFFTTNHPIQTKRQTKKHTTCPDSKNFNDLQ